MIFDNQDMIEFWLSINKANEPYVNNAMDFPKKHYVKLSPALLGAGLNDISVETVFFLDYAQFGSLYLIIPFNLSHHKSYTDLSNLMIQFHWRLKLEPGES